MCSSDLTPFRMRPGSRPRTPARVFAVGQHAFINCPGDGSGSAELGDELGESVSTSQLADGVDVEVLAWRPRTPTGPRYRVRALCGAAEGWLPAANLRTVFVAIPAATVKSPPPVSPAIEVVAPPRPSTTARLVLRSSS